MRSLRPEIRVIPEQQEGLTAYGATFNARALTLLELVEELESERHWRFVAAPSRPVKLDEYRACGCGCCGGVDSPVVCIEDVDRSVADIIAEDQSAAQISGCQYAGCALGTLYVPCAADH